MGRNLTERQRGILFLVLLPLIYVYGLLENHFNYRRLYRAYTYDFFTETVNAIRVVFGKEYIDKSLEVAKYEYILKSKKSKLSSDIYEKLHEAFSRHNISFNHKIDKTSYIGYDGEDRFIIYNHGKNKYKVLYYKNVGFNKKYFFESDYMLTSTQVCDIIDLYKTLGDD